MTSDDSFYRLLREWFTVFLPRQRAASPHTITACRHTWNMLLGWVSETQHVTLDKITLADLDRATVTGFLNHMRQTKNWSPATYNQRLACIRSFFKYSSACQPMLTMYLDDLTAIPLLKNTQAGPIAYMSEAAITALLAQPDPATRTGLGDQFFMILMYDTAARDGEMLALRLGDIDTKRGCIDLMGKGAKPRRIPLTKQTLAHYRRYAAAFHPDGNLDQQLFYTIHHHKKTTMSDDNVARFIRQHAQAAHSSCPEVPAKTHPHMLRHARAMHSLPRRNALGPPDRMARPHRPGNHSHLRSR